MYKIVLCLTLQQSPHQIDTPVQHSMYKGQHAMQTCIQGVGFTVKGLEPRHMQQLYM